MATRSVLATGSTVGVSASFADSGALPSASSTPLDNSHGLVAFYRRVATDQPTTPSGWTLIGGGTLGAASMWVYARRCDGSVNSITVVAPTAASVAIQLNAYAGVYADDFWIPTTSNGTTTASGTSLASATVASTEPGMTAVACTFLHSSATSFAWSNSFTVRATGSSFTWAEKDIPTTGTSVSTTASWTTARAARLVMVLLRTTAPVNPSSNVKWRTSDGVMHNATMKWRDAADAPGVVHNFSLGAPTTPPAASLRTAFDHPFKVDAFSNLALGNTATYEGVTGRTAKFLTGTPTLNGIGGSAARWTFLYYRAQTTDPLRDVINADTGAVITTIRIPDSAEASGGTDRHVGIVQPNGYSANEIYKWVRLSNGNVSTTYHNATDLRGDGLQRGSRASGISFFHGTIRDHEAMARLIPHTVALGAPAVLLNSQATSTDGQTVNVSQTVNGVTSSYKAVWPSRLIDTQTGANIYANATNNLAFGSMWAIPPSVEIETLGLTADGLALARCLQDYGGHILVQSAYMTLYAQPSTDPVIDARYTAMKTAWQNVLFPLMRRVTNNIPGTLVSHSPVSSAGVAGGDSAGRRRTNAAPLLEDQAAVGTAPLNQIVCWGDSLTQSTGTNWPALLATDLGVTVSNQGVGGMGTSDIALRQGGLVPKVTITGNSIPASTTAVAVAGISPATGWRTNGTGAFTRVGRLGGVPGTLRRDLVTNSFSFTRTTAAASPTSISAKAGADFVGDELLANHRRMISVFWTGRNNSFNPAPEQVTVNSALMANFLTPIPKEYVVLGVINASSEGVGTTFYNTIVSINSALASAHPGRYIDIRRYLIDSGLAAAAITPTSQDNADIANDVIPTSLRADSLHLNSAGYGVVADRVSAFITAAGWLA